MYLMTQLGPLSEVLTIANLQHVARGSFNQCVRNIFRKTNIFCPLIHTRKFCKRTKRVAQSSIWTYAQPEFSLCWIKSGSRDNHCTMAPRYHWRIVENVMLGWWFYTCCFSWIISPLSKMQPFLVCSVGNILEDVYFSLLKCSSSFFLLVV